MADASGVFAIRAVALDSTDWTPIVCPIACNTWAVRADAPILVRTDAADPTTQDSLGAGAQMMVTATKNTPGVRFGQGETFLFAQAQSGTTTLHASFSL